jgi:hypothetical protein
MQLGGKVRAAVDNVTAAAADTKQAIVGVGVLAVLALGLALIALVLGARRPAGTRL